MSFLPLSAECIPSVLMEDYFSAHSQPIEATESIMHNTHDERVEHICNQLREDLKGQDVHHFHVGWMTLGGTGDITSRQFDHDATGPRANSMLTSNFSMNIPEQASAIELYHRLSFQLDVHAAEVTELNGDRNTLIAVGDQEEPNFAFVVPLNNSGTE